MGIVVRFEPTTAEPPARSPLLSHLDAYLAIETGKAEIEASIRAVESAILDRENRDLRHFTLRQLTEIRSRLLLASSNLLKAKRGLLKIAASSGRSVPSAHRQSKPFAPKVPNPAAVRS